MFSDRLLGIVPVPPHWQVGKHAKANFASAQVRDRRRSPGRSSRVLRNAATVRPVFFCDFHQVDHHVPRPHLQLRIHVVDDALVKRLLQLGGPPRIQCNLDQNDILAVMIAQIALADIEGFDRMFGDDLEFIVLRHIDHVAHRIIDDFTDRLSIFDGLTPHEIDANKRHDAASYVSRWRSGAVPPAIPQNRAFVRAAEKSARRHRSRSDLRRPRSTSSSGNCSDAASSFDQPGWFYLWDCYAPGGCRLMANSSRRARSPPSRGLASASM